MSCELAQVLENVSMEIDLAELEDVEIDESLSVPLKRMPHNSVGPVFVVLKREEGSLSRGTMSTNMKFIVKEVDPASGEVEEDGYDDEYQLEDLEVTSSPFCVLGAALHCFCLQHKNLLAYPMASLRLEISRLHPHNRLWRKQTIDV
jgi:hypothetical protein